MSFAEADPSYLVDVSLVTVEVPEVYIPQFVGLLESSQPSKVPFVTKLEPYLAVLMCRVPLGELASAPMPSLPPEMKPTFVLVPLTFCLNLIAPLLLSVLSNLIEATN